MSKNKSQTPNNVPELERLRDILYGDYARNTDTNLTELKDRLQAFERQTLETFASQGNSSAAQLETTRQDFEDKLAHLTETVNQQMAELRKEMAAHVARIEEAMTNRRVLGQLLSEMSQQLLKEENGEG